MSIYICHTGRQKRKACVFILIQFDFLTFSHLEKLTFKIMCHSRRSHVMRFSSLQTLGEKTKKIKIWEVGPNFACMGLTSNIGFSGGPLSKWNQNQTYCLVGNHVSALHSIFNLQPLIGLMIKWHIIFQTPKLLQINLKETLFDFKSVLVIWWLMTYY